VERQDIAVVHAIHMVRGEDENIPWPEPVEIREILEHGIGGARVTG
jgi:hypothetical protein